ncbi:MAG: hypothetical protein Q9183_003083 [Haloplaca sp. 2 TL-2023]
MFPKVRSSNKTRPQHGTEQSLLKAFLRSIGLELLGVAFQLILQLRSLRSPEHEKVVVKKSRPHAIARCAVHIIPTLFSIVLIALNLRHYYIGIHLTGQITNDSTNRLLLQGAAKIQELLITSSLATVVFDVIRSALMYGDGIPLGLLGSGFTFTQLSFFWSPDFWCSIWYKSRVWRKAFVITIVVASGFLAATAGPACAVLVIPRVQSWDAGGTFFYLNGSESQLWPEELTYDPDGDQPYCSFENATSYSVCPSSGYNSLWSHFRNVNVSNFVQVGTKLPYAGNLSGLMYHFEVASPTFQVPLQLAIGAVRNDLPRIPTDPASGNTFLVQPHAASIIPVRQLTLDWWAAVHNISLASPRNIARYRYTDTVGVRSNNRQASAGVRCSKAQNVSANSQDVAFPLLPFSSDQSNSIVVDALNASRVDHVRFSWFRLPQDPWTHEVTIGAVIEMPWTTGHNSRIVIGCSVHARYESSIIQHAGPNYAFHSNAGYPGPSYVVGVTDAWLDALTPKTPKSGPGYLLWQPTTMESIITASGVGEALSDSADTTQAMQWDQENFADGGNRTTLLEMLISSQMVDGLSRFGSHRAFNTAGSPSSWPLWDYERGDDFETKLLQGRHALVTPTSGEGVTELRADFSIYGHSFKATEQSDKLAMAVFVAHMIIALSHTIWILYHGTSSGSWDKLSEYFALLQNSRPAPIVLRNTAAGLRAPTTYQRLAKIRVTENLDGSGTDHVELIFEEERTRDDVELRSLTDNAAPMQNVDEVESLHVQAGHEESRSIGGRPTPAMPSLAERIRPSFKSRSSSSAGLLPSQNRGATTAIEYMAYVEIDKVYG